MSSLRLLALAVVVAVAVPEMPAAAPASSCQALQLRMEALRLAIKKAPGKGAAAQATAELDRLVAQAARVCPSPGGAKTSETASSPIVAPRQLLPGQAETPEEECKRRRDMINRGQVVPGLPRSAGREVAGGRAIPLTGSLMIEGRASTTMYGAAKQELSYAIRETFVGNLIVTRSQDAGAGSSGGREDYAIQTFSTEIDVEHFSGRGCVKFSGSPPGCNQWLPIDLWQIGDGEEYPGRADGVVSAASDGRGVALRADGPVIEFGSSQGPVNIRSGCIGVLRETVSRDEIKQWLRRSTVHLKREAGRPSPGCAPGLTITLELRFGPDS